MLTLSTSQTDDKEKTDQSTTARLYDEACRYMPGGTSRIHYYFPPCPIYAHSAQGCTVTDVEGVERLDCLNNMTALIHGHGHPGDQGGHAGSGGARDRLLGAGRAGGAAGPAAGGAGGPVWTRSASPTRAPKR